MSRVYEIPTHLQVEDALIAGLTPRQLLRLVGGASVAYAVWDQLAFLPTGLRAGLAASAALLGVMFALVQPAGRPLDQWVFAAALFQVSPSRWRWRRTELLKPENVEPAEEWSELVSPVGWAREPVGQVEAASWLSAAGGLVK
jgi:hypothetical protein